MGTIVRKSGRMYRDNVAVSFAGRRQTYGEVLDRAARLANGLAALGVSVQDRVAVLSDNVFETVEIAAACALGNTPIATLYTYYTIDTNVYLLEKIGATALIVDPRHLPLIEPRLSSLPDLKAVLVLGEKEHPGLLRYDDLVATADSTVPEIEARPDDAHIIRFSSGTTGRPKGIYYNVRDWLAYNSEWRWMTPQLSELDTYLAATSLAHLSVAYLWGMLAVGATLAPMPVFDAAEFGRLVEEERATYAAMVPTMIQKVLGDPSAVTRDYSSLRCITYAGAPISEQTMRGAIRLFGPVLHQMYAQSEVAPVTMLLPHEHELSDSDRARRLLRSAGRPSPNVVLTIVDDEGRPLPTGQVGEVAARSPGAMSGLWGDPETYATRVLPDGSVLTRDMGYVDEEGFLYLADRKDDMIISGGYNVWPLEIEEALVSHPGVAQACVVGVPHDVWGETPLAFVVRTDDVAGEQVDEGELIALTRDRLGKVKRIAAVRFVTELPVSGAGKVQRAVLRKPFWEGRESLVGGS
ncbi:MAG: AMP-binding protein [Nocardioides sp.]|uniref:class I adenylate-forming enzyme family protein n=1 Tax=Nocardioides sp. TaxID=35761 RepID=UPI0039E41063